MRKELQDLFNARMAELMKSQMEATKMTVDAANKLANIHQSNKRVKSSSSARGRGPVRVTPHHVPDDLKTMISNTESSIPGMCIVLKML